MANEQMPVAVQTAAAAASGGQVATEGQAEGAASAASGGQSPAGGESPASQQPAAQALPPAQNLVMRRIGGQSVYGTVASGGNFFSEDGTILQLPDGFVEHGKTGADGTFLAEMTVNGKVVWGNYGADGSFSSQDGTIYVPPNGQPETGITDPVTGQFLPDGAVRHIGGQSVYGSVESNGDFFSEDGTILQLPDGFVEHGKTGADGTFLAEMTVNGKVVWGNYGADGSFSSQDGTIYVPPNGQPETGVTTPDGTFLKGGTTHTLPNGTVLYGYTDDGSFYTNDGTAMVLSNGTEVTGSLSTSSGIFTGNNGNDYFIGQNGIVQVTPQPDGSFKEPDGSVVMTAKSWSVDLEQLSTSTQMVQDIRAAISDAYLRIKFQYLEIMAAWQSPAGQSFDEVTSTIDRAMGQLDLVIATVIGAMQESHQNYQQAEQANTSNFTGS